MSILNTACQRSLLDRPHDAEYNRDIWQLEPVAPLAES